MAIQVMIVMVMMMLALPCPSANAGSIREGEWSMTMTTQYDGNSAEAKQMREAMKGMENMSPEEQAMMKGMQGRMGIQMGAGPQGGMTTTVTQCLTDKDPVPQMGPSARNCQETHEVKGNTITFQSVCKDKTSETTTTGRMTYTGNAMKGETKSHEVSRGRTTDVTVDIAGQYVGPCKAGKEVDEGNKGKKGFGQWFKGEERS